MPPVLSRPLESGHDEKSVSVILVDDDVMDVDECSPDSDLELMDPLAPCGRQPGGGRYHFMEIYSPLRVAPSIHRLGMKCAGSLDVLNGCCLLYTSPSPRDA